jgi:hypothetical protein
MLLTHVAVVAPRESVDDWIQAATMYGGHLAAATDLSTPARQLVDCGLAKDGVWIEVAPQLTALVEHERGLALREIAQLLLLASPPVWLLFAVSDAGVAREYIPESDLKALRWLEPDLDSMLTRAYEQLSSAESASHAKEIGDAGELFVLAALRYAGARATHVAQFSDAFGYDIDVNKPDRQRLEVKAAGPKTAGQFHLTRNEFMACERHGKEWRIVQVVFNSAAFIARELNVSHVTGIYALESATILSIVPPDTEHFIWQESAKIRPSEESWRQAGLVLDPNFKIPGFAPKS